MHRFLLPNVAKFLVVVLSLFFQIGESDQKCLFHLGNEWRVVDHTKMAKSVKQSYLCKQRGDAPFTTVVTTEKLIVSEEAYLSAVEKRHREKPGASVINLGKINTLSGKATLLQIDLSNQSVPLKLLQLILCHENSAYIITGSCSQKGYLDAFPVFREIFQSVQIVSEIDSVLTEEEKTRLKAIRVKAAQTKKPRKIATLYKKELEKIRASKGVVFALLVMEEEWEKINTFSL